MTISVTFDASVNATQQAAILAVATFFNAHFLDPVSIDIAVSFSALGPNGLGASSYGLSTYSFSDIINALTIDAASADDSTAVVSLPSSDPVTGTHSWTMTPAEAMALGLISDNGATQDGSVSFSNAASFDYDRSDGITTGAFDFFGVVAHEFTETMGRELNAIGNNVASGGGYHPLDLFKYASAGTREFVGSNAGYFSLDGGATALLDFNTSPNGDFGDWAASAGSDSFLAFSSSGVFNLVSLADLRVMDAIGWQVRETAPVIAALVRAVGEDGPSLSQDLLAGASDAENDALFIMNMAASVGAVGTSAVAPTLFVNGDYVLTGSTMALTAAGFAKFNALAAGQSATGILGYDVSDGILTTHNTLTLTVNGINDGPTAVADVGAATENQNVSFDVLANDTDPDVGDTKTLISLGSVMANSANPLINGIDATNAFSIVNNQVRFDPGSSFDALAVGDTAMVTVGYTMADGQNVQSSSKLTLAVSGENDPPVIASGGGGDSATYWVRVNNSAITTVRASDVDYGDTVKFEVVGGADARRFIIDQDTGELSFKSLPVKPHASYQVQVAATDGNPGGIDVQTITVNVEADKMLASADNQVPNTFVFHDRFGANTISGFDVLRDILQFDKGMFGIDTPFADTVHAVLDAARDDGHGNVIIQAQAARLMLQDTTVATLAAHPNDIQFA